MNRDGFITLARKLLTELELDHEEHTGVSSTEEMSFYSWLQEVNNLYENTQ